MTTKVRSGSSDRRTAGLGVRESVTNGVDRCAGEKPQRQRCRDFRGLRRAAEIRHPRIAIDGYKRSQEPETVVALVTSPFYGRAGSYPPLVKRGAGKKSGSCVLRLLPVGDGATRPPGPD